MVNRFINSASQYGWVSISLHWSMAIALVGMYLLGDYMVELDYYHVWYHKAPALHKVIGIILGLVLVLRIVWNFAQARPAALDKNRQLQFLAKLGHAGLYLLMLVMVGSGYLISTAKGQGIDVFGWFLVPAFLPNNAARGELAGQVHAISNTLFMAMILLHGLAALWHHFIMKDRTLVRMLLVRREHE